MEPSIREPFAKLKHIKESLIKKNIYPALEWAKENRAVLDTQVNIQYKYNIFIMKYCFKFITDLLK